MTDDLVKLSDILLAAKRLKGHTINTPFLKSPWLSEITGAEVYLKLENLQTTGSFKFRGAMNALSWAKDNHLSKIFTASAGNHGLGVAEASLHTDRDVTVCLPLTVSPAKKQKLQSYNVAVISHGDDCEVTESFARRLASEKKGFYVSPYNNKEVIAGQGTIALEMLEAEPRLNKIVVAVGGGGLISGTAIAAKAINPNISVVGVVAAHSASMRASINAGRISPAIQSPTIADGLAGNIEPDSITFPIAQEFVDDWITVEEDEIVSALFEFLSNQGMLIEGAAATALAAVLKKHVSIAPREKIGLIVCGGNIARNVWREIVVQHLTGTKKS